MNGTSRYEARVARIVDHNRDTRSIFIALEGHARLDFIPGQFISVEIPSGEATRPRPYSIASDPDHDGPIEICLNLVPGGVGSQYLFDLKPGAALNFTGPFGAFTLAQAPQAEAVFIAEATAIAPIRPMIHRMAAAADHRAMRLIHAASESQGHLYRSEFEQLATRDRDFAFEPLTTEPVAGFAKAPAGLRQAVELRYVAAPSDRSRRFFICGVGNSVIELRDLLRGAGYERRAVAYERW